MSDVKNSAGNEMKGEESVCISRSTVRMRLGVRPYQRGTLPAQIDDRRKSSVGVERFWLDTQGASCSQSRQGSGRGRRRSRWAATMSASRGVLGIKAGSVVGRRMTNGLTGKGQELRDYLVVVVAAGLRADSS